MSTEKIIDSLFDNNLEQFRSEVRAALYVKAGDYMNSAKQVVAQGMFGQPEEVQEELKGNQKKLDVAPPYGKLTGADFKKLREKTNVKEGYAYPEGEVDDDCFGDCHQKNVYGKSHGEYHDAFEDCVRKCKKKG